MAISNFRSKGGKTSALGRSTSATDIRTSKRAMRKKKPTSGTRDNYRGTSRKVTSAGYDALGSGLSSNKRSRSGSKGIPKKDKLGV